MNLIEVGLYLYRSVHVLDDDDARLMRDSAYQAGASVALVASALRLRDQRKAADVRGIPARFDERYDPSPEPIDRRIS